MRSVIKKAGKIVQGYKLGEKNAVIDALIAEGKIKQKKDGSYELFSQEAVNGIGEVAYPGDYVKIDSKGYPYPNSREFFEKNHRHIAGNDYEQMPKPLEAWTAEDAMLNEEVSEKYFEAPLWGSILSAAKDAVLIFYRIDRDADGKITDADFNFVARDEFERTYNEC